MLVRLQRLLLPSWAIMLINKAGRGLTWEFHARLTSAGTVLLISVRPHAILQVYARPVIWQNGR
jgi:hypothetical protein